MEGPCVEWVGKQLACTLKVTGDSIKGEVFTYDKATDTLVMKDHTVGLHEADYRFIKGKDVELSSVKLEGTNRVPEPAPALEDVTVERLRRKESEHVAKEMAKATNIGDGVSTYAQQVFNGLSKTMQCSWEGSVIVVQLAGPEDAVRIRDPYDNVEGRNSQMKERVKKVLEGECQRIRQGG